MSYEDLQNKFLSIYTPSLKETHKELIVHSNQKQNAAYITATLVTVGWLGFLGVTGLLWYILASTLVLVLVLGVLGITWGIALTGLGKYRKHMGRIYNQHFQAKFIEFFVAEHHFGLDWQQENKFSYKDFMQLGLLQVFGEVINSFGCSQSFQHRYFPYQQAFIQFKTQEEGLDIKGCLYIFDYPQSIKAKTILSAQAPILVMDKLMGLLKKKKFKKTDPAELDESMEAYPFFQLWSNNTSHSYSIFNDVLKQLFDLLTLDELRSSTFVWTNNKLILFIQSSVSEPFSVKVQEEFISPKKYTYSKIALTLGEQIAEILDKYFSTPNE